MNVYNRRTSSVNLNQLVGNIPVRRKAADQVERDKFEWNQVCRIMLVFQLIIIQEQNKWDVVFVF
jgi:hypothetical protein